MNGDVGSPQRVVSRNGVMADYSKIAEKIQTIRMWISGPGEKLLASQTSKPYNFNEAATIRKAHEQFEFKCMKALEDFAILCEFRKQNSPNNDLTELDFLVQDFIDRLNKRTFFVVSCYSYFKLMEELWESLEDLNKRAREVDTYDLASIIQSINGIDYGLEKVDSRLSSLAHELERLKVILVSTDTAYLGQLENLFNDACKTASERTQEMRIQKLVLKKYSKLLECENNVQESVGWIEELLENVDSLYQDNCVGKNQLEASELLKKCSSIYKQAQTTYTYSSQLLETYCKLCEAEGRKIPRNVGSCKNRLSRVWPRLESRIREFKERAGAAESVYTHSDMILGRVQEYLLDANRSPIAFDRTCDSLAEDVHLVTDEQHRKQLEQLLKEFHQTKTLAMALLERLSRGLLSDDSEFSGPAMDEVSRLMRLRLYTLWLKIREYEAVILGYNTADSTTATELGMDTIRPLFRSRSTTSTGPRRELSVAAFEEFVSPPMQSPQFFDSGRKKPPLIDWSKGNFQQSAQAKRRSGTDPRTRSMPSLFSPVPPPDSKAYVAPRLSQPTTGLAAKTENGFHLSRESNKDSAFAPPNEIARHLSSVLKQFELHLNELKPRTGEIFDENGRQQIRTEGDRELVRLENHIGDVLNNPQHPPSDSVREIAERSLVRGRRLHKQWLADWETWTPTISEAKDVQLVRLGELFTDLSECQNRLYDLINAVCLTTAQNAEAVKLLRRSPSNSCLIPDAIADEDIKRIGMVCEETQGMKETIPAQEEFISNLLSTVRTGQYIQPNVEKVKKIWRNYKQTLTIFDEFVNTLERGYILLLRKKKYIDRRNNILRDLRNGKNDISNLQADGRSLEKDITDFLASPSLSSLSTRLTQSTKAKPSIDWLANQLKEDLNELKDVIDELNMLAANIRSTSSQDNVDLTAILPSEFNSMDDHRTDTLRTPSLTQFLPFAQQSGQRTPKPTESFEIPPPLPPRAQKLPMHGDGARNGFNVPTSSKTGSVTEHKDILVPFTQWRITRPLNDISCKADDEVVLRCEFSGPTDKSLFNISWSYRPFIYTPKGIELGQKTRLPKGQNEVLEDVGIDYAQLHFKPIDASRAGYYTMRLRNVKTGNAMKSGAKVFVRPYISKELQDTTVPIVDPKTGQLGSVAFTVCFRGFVSSPKIQWLHDGLELDSKSWQATETRTSATIKSNSAKISDQGLYECHLLDLQTGMKLVSRGWLNVDKVQKPSAHVPLSIGEAKLGQPLVIRCPLPEDVDVTQCDIDWLHNDQTIYTYQPRSVPSNRAGSVSSRNGSRENTFQYNETTWRTYVANGCCVLATNHVHQTDSGNFTCRIHTENDIFESSGKFAVRVDLEFVEPLQSITIQSGQPLFLHCRLNRTVEPTHSSTFSDDPTTDALIPYTVEWFHNEAHLTPYKCIRVGATTHVSQDTLSLIIGKANAEHAGIYRCKVYTKDAEVETQCNVTVEASIVPQITTFERKPKGTLTVGQTVTITVHFESDELPNYVWSRNSQPINRTHANVQDFQGPNYCQLIINNIQQNQSGIYKLTLWTKSGSAEFSEPIVVNEHSEPDNSSRTVPSRGSPIVQELTSSTSPTSSLTFKRRSAAEVFLISPTNTTAYAGERLKFLCVISLLKDCYSVVWSHCGAVLMPGGEFHMQNNIPRRGVFVLEIKSLKPSHAGSYTIEVVCNTNGDTAEKSPCITETTFMLNVIENERTDSSEMFGPQLSANAEKDKHVSAAFGEELSLSYSITGSPTPSFTWIKNQVEVVRPVDEKISITHMNSEYGLIIHSADFTDQGLYELFCYNPYNFLVLNRLVTVSQLGADQSDMGGPKYTTPEVIRDRSQEPKSIRPEIIFSTQTQTAAATTNNKMKITPPEFKSIFTDTVCRAGETVRLSCRVQGCPTPTVTWSLGGEPLGRLESRFREEKQGDEYTLVIESTAPKDSGRYFLTAENSVGLATCSGTLFVRSASVNRSLSPLSEPGYFTYSPGHVDWADSTIVNGSPRRHSGTQTPVRRRVEVIRSVTVSHREENRTEHKNPLMATCPYCRHLVAPCTRHAFNESSILDRPGSRLWRQRHGTRSRIRRSSLYPGAKPLTRHRSEELLIPVCANCNTPLRPVAPVASRSCSNIFAGERIFTPLSPRDASASRRLQTRQPTIEQPSTSHVHAQPQISKSTAPIREIPIQFEKVREKVIEPRKTVTSESQKMYTHSVTTIKPRDKVPLNVAEKFRESQFSTVESSDCE